MILFICKIASWRYKSPVFDTHSQAWLQGMIVANFPDLLSLNSCKFLQQKELKWSRSHWTKVVYWDPFQWRYDGEFLWNIFAVVNSPSNRWKFQWSTQVSIRWLQQIVDKHFWFLSLYLPLPRAPPQYSPKCDSSSNKEQYKIAKIHKHTSSRHSVTTPTIILSKAHGLRFWNNQFLE